MEVGLARDFVAPSDAVVESATADGKEALGAVFLADIESEFVVVAGDFFFLAPHGFPLFIAAFSEGAVDL